MMKSFAGVAASPGYAYGPAHRLGQNIIVPERCVVANTEVPQQIERFKSAVDLAKQQIEKLVERLNLELGPGEADILSAQLLILEDEMVWDATLAVIRLERINAEAAFARAVGDIAARFLEMENETFRERVNDLHDVEQRVLRAFQGSEEVSLDLPAVPSIIVATNLTPSDTATLGRTNVLGFLMEEGGNTSHVAILARSIGVPAVVGLKSFLGIVDSADPIAVDGNTGIFIADPDNETINEFRRLQADALVKCEKLASLRDLDPITPDGHRIRLMANIELPVEVDEALARGAEGIGLLRTEYLYFQHNNIPTEDEQTSIYSDLIKTMAGKPVIFRTLDVGGDKVSDYLGAKREYNPFLGWRGIRFSLANRSLFRNQLKAICRAAVAGPVKIMFPMISGVQELRQAKEIYLEAVAELESEGKDFHHDLDLGIMVETPSAVLVADLLAAECDFFSIGSNDLIQYTLAMDRGNARVSYLYQPLHPSILRAIKTTVEAAHRAGIWVGLCGEMGSETRLAEVLLGLGLDEISLHGAALPKVKQVIRWTTLEEAEALVEKLMNAATAEEANQWLAQYIQDRKDKRQNKEY
ncbi:MAG: phosphoenolpyruvate--protein phosphotransferase [bacterium]|nr:phosphoenolpyruvate--protein phosphotransferase [bacterium]